MNAIRINAYAKINLSLYVTGRRADGYHDISSFMQAINLFDSLCLKTIIPKKYDFYCLEHGTRIYLCTDTNTIPLNMDNLALRGIKAVIGALKPEKIRGLPYLTIELEKKLPVAAGIAGGSGNAAACMLALNQLLGSPFTLKELMKLGVKVGADVPFSLMMNAYKNREVLSSLEGIGEASEAAVVKGIGDVVASATPRPYYVLIFNPTISVSTKEVYEAIDTNLSEKCRSLNNITCGANKIISRSGSFDIKDFHNDLELYTLAQYDDARRLKLVMQENLQADYILMSGSGPTIVAYYNDRNCLEADFKAVQNAKWMETNWRVWKTRSGGSDVWN